MKKPNKQELVYFLVKFFNQYYLMGIWVLFYLNITDYKGIGIIEAVQIAVMFISEIPTGMFADRFGRKKSVTVGLLIIAISNILMAYSTTLTHLIISASLIAFGITFISGALDALMYDYYPEKNREEKYTKVISKGNAISAIAIALSTIAGGYLYTIDFKLPMIATTISFVIATVISMFFTEKSIKKDITPEISFNVKQLFKEAVSPKIVLGLLVLASIMSLVYEGMEDYQAVAYGYTAIPLSILMALLFITSALGSSITPWLRKRINDFKLIFIVLFIYACIWLLGPFLTIYIGGAFMLLRATLTGLYTNIQSIVLNRQLPSSKRATLLSVFSMLSTIPYVLLAYFIGSFIQKYSALWVGFILGIVCLLSLIFLSYLWKDKIFRKKI